MIREWLHHSVEFQHFGWNIPTMTFGFTIVFLWPMASGIIDHCRRIQRGRSAEGFDLTFYVYLSAYMFALLVYGVHKQ